MKKFIEETGMTLKQFSDYYQIPYITVQQWKAGKRTAPSYLVKIMRENYELKKQGAQLSLFP